MGKDHREHSGRYHEGAQTSHGTTQVKGPSPRYQKAVALVSAYWIGDQCAHISWDVSSVTSTEGRCGGCGVLGQVFRVVYHYGKDRLSKARLLCKRCMVELDHTG